MIKKYHGVIPPIITPVDKKENVDEQGFRGLIDYCIDGGLHGIFVCGTNGETMAVTQAERNHAIQIAVDQVAGRVPVIAGVMDTSTRRVVDNIKALEQLGGTSAAVTPIFYDRHTSQDETIRHFERILEETSLPELVIYNIPPFTGLKLTAATVMAIAKLSPRIVAYKDSSGSYSEFLQILSAYRDTPFSVMQGVTPHAMTSLIMGADGFVPALAPAFPQMFTDAYNAGVSGNAELAWKYNELIRESSKILGMSKNGTAAAKYAISLRGFTDKRVIWPQDVTTAEEEARIREKLAEVDQLYQALKVST